ncbi:MAG: CPBP family intramembrane metalloprotease [Lachnospiraceae bacterium]|nr:CPBP family intramembrane metalloprotease [Lachnospiraceae bacterium]
MNKYLNEPTAVKEARESQKGLHIVLEILIFVAVFLVCSFAQGLIMAPVEMIFLFSNGDYVNAMMSGDMAAIMNESMTAAMDMASSDWFMAVSLFSTALMIIVTMLFCKFAQKRKMSSLGFVKKGAGKEYIKGVIAGFLLFSAAVLFCIVTGALKIEGLSDTFAIGTFLLYVFGFMIQGMAEEVLCRGYFMVSVGRRYSMLVAVIANSLAFAALHLFNAGIGVLPLINLTLFGIFASVCFIKTDNIWLVGAIHSVWNLVQGNVYGIKVSGMDTPCTIFTSAMTEGKDIIHGGAFGLEGGIAVTIVLVIGTVILLMYKKKESV